MSRAAIGGEFQFQWLFLALDANFRRLYRPLDRQPPHDLRTFEDIRRERIHDLNWAAGVGGIMNFQPRLEGRLSEDCARQRAASPRRPLERHT